MNAVSCKTEYDFVLVLTGITSLSPAEEDSLFEAGCSDATISVRAGRVYLTFSRLADSLREAILTAVEDVRRAKIGAEVLRVDACNLVSQADIARKIERSRQLVHQYISGVRGPGAFPAPVCELGEDSPLWYWSDVANWLWQNDMIKEEVLREAQEIAVINNFLELAHQRQTQPELTGEVERWFDSKSGKGTL